MHSNGKYLERLVAFVEELSLPAGFSVQSNTRVFNDDGVQIAEFDIEIRGKLGTTSIAWLIECRDRPGHGPAPGSWVEQLVGRRQRFGFNKVTAVSTTGFAVGAIEFANSSDIELREVRNLNPEEFSSWLQIGAMQCIRRIADLKHANIYLMDNTHDDTITAAAELIRQSNGNVPLLISSVTGERCTLSKAYLRAVNSLENLFDGVTLEKPRAISIRNEYKDQDYFLIETDKGSARVRYIEFHGELRIEEELLPIVGATEYGHINSSQQIAQIVSFAPHKAMGMNLAVEFHRMIESGETRIMLRRLPDEM